MFFLEKDFKLIAKVWDPANLMLYNIYIGYVMKTRRIIWYTTTNYTHICPKYLQLHTTYNINILLYNEYTRESMRAKIH